MKKIIKFAAFALIAITAFMFVGCGTPAAYDLDGNKFGKEKTVSSAEYLSNMQVSTVDVAEDSSITKIHFTTSVNMTMKIPVYGTVKVSVVSENYFDTILGNYYIETKTTTNITDKETISYYQEAGKNDTYYTHTGSTKLLASELLATSGYPISNSTFSTIFSEVVTEMQTILEKSENFEGFVKKITKQTTDSAIKYNFVFDSKKLKQAITEYISTSPELGDQMGAYMSATDFSKLKMDYYLIFLKDANGNPKELIEVNTDFSFKVTYSESGFKISVTTNAGVNYRVKEINDDVVMPF